MGALRSASRRVSRVLLALAWSGARGALLSSHTLLVLTIASRDAAHTRNTSGPQWEREREGARQPRRIGAAGPPSRAGAPLRGWTLSAAGRDDVRLRSGASPSRERRVADKHLAELRLGAGVHGSREASRRRHRNNSSKFESAGLLPNFTLSGVDVEKPGVLARVVEQVAFLGEIILICGDASAFASPTALNTVLQFWALRLRHTLYVSDSGESCAKIRSALPDLACVWSSSIPTTKPHVTSECIRK
eukprot:scaffold262142_cov37-Tisochrysis_lutea.AAC.1